MPERAQETRGHYLLTSGKKGGAGDTLSPFIKVISLFKNDEKCYRCGRMGGKMGKPFPLVGIALSSSCLRVAF